MMWFARPPLHSQIVCFDFDGVIANSLAVWQRMLISLSPDAIAQRLHDQEVFLDCFSGNMWRGLRTLGCRRRDIARIVPRLTGSASKALQQVEPFADIIAVVSALCEKYPCMIITSNHGPTVEQWCIGHGLHAMRSVEGVEVSHSKVRKIRRQQRRFRPESTLYIGDTTGDYHEAKRAGAQFIGVAWGWHGEQRLGEAGARVVRSPQELLAACQ
ncbi:MAG: HAD family hydrolase [Planctomycetota bacterium]|nr:MAG: HAD family hydrolase [Planctomycetota bacterium]